MGRVVAITNGEKFEEKDYLEQKALMAQKTKEIEKNALKEEDINPTLIQGASNEAILAAISSVTQLALNTSIEFQKMRVEMDIYKQDYEERKNMCNDKEVQSINDTVNSAVQSILVKFKLIRTKGEKNCRKAATRILKGKIKKNYHIRFWAKNNTKIPKTLLQDVLLSIPQLAREITLGELKDRAHNYKESEDERNAKREADVIDNMKKEGRAYETTDSIILKKDEEENK